MAHLPSFLLLGAFPFFLGTVQAQTRFLSFPVPGDTSVSAPISSVFDHSMGVPYSENGEVIAYTGERGSVPPGDCYAAASNEPFRINGNYRGTITTGPARLCYDGHPAIDYRYSSGTDVHSAAAGRVVGLKNDCQTGVKSCAGGRGNFVIIDHDNGYQTLYFHLMPGSVSVGFGSVQAGTRIGKVGATGNITGPHLHLEVRRSRTDIPVDPYGWQGTGSDPYTRATNVNLWLNGGPSIPNNALVKADNSDPTIYWSQNSRFYGIPRQDVVTAMGGLPGWNINDITPVPANILTSSTIGPVFILAANDPQPKQSDGLLIQMHGRPEVYLVENNRVRWIRSPEARDWQGVNHDPEVIKVTSAIFSGYLGVSGNDPTCNDRYYGYCIYTIGEGENTTAIRAKFVDAYNRTVTDPYCSRPAHWKGWPGEFSNCLRFPAGTVRSGFDSSISRSPSKFQEFANASTVLGSLQYNGNNGNVYAVWGAIYSKWAELDYGRGPLGHPIADEHWATEAEQQVRRTDFEGGYIYWEPWPVDRVTVVYNSTGGDPELPPPPPANLSPLEQQAYDDMRNRATTDPRFESELSDSFGLHPNWHPDWTLRYLKFAFSDSRQVWVFHATMVANTNRRYTIFFDPDSNGWTRWQRAR